MYLPTDANTTYIYILEAGGSLERGQLVCIFPHNHQRGNNRVYPSLSILPHTSYPEPLLLYRAHPDSCCRCPRTRIAYLNESHVFHRNNWHHVDLHPQQAGPYIFVEETLGTGEVRGGHDVAHRGNENNLIRTKVGSFVEIADMLDETLPCPS